MSIFLCIICQNLPVNVATQAHYMMSVSKKSSVYISLHRPLMMLSICCPEDFAAECEDLPYLV